MIRWMKQEGFAPILIVLLIAIVGIGGYFVYRNYSNNQSNQTKPSSTPVTTPQTSQPTPSQTPTDETANWKTYKTENSFYKFSIQAPIDANVYLDYHESPPTSFIKEDKNEITLDDNQWITGIFLKGDNYPYGIVINYTSLDESSEKTLLADELKTAMLSDIDFSVKGALMMKGKSTRTIRYIGKNTPDRLETKTFLYTKYIFRNGGLLYVINIQTDEKLTNFALFKQILSTFKFTQ